MTDLETLNDILHTPIGEEITVTEEIKEEILDLIPHVEPVPEPVEEIKHVRPRHKSVHLQD